MNSVLLKEKRRKKGFTQTQMGKKLNYSGKTGYSMLESGKVKITLEKAYKIKEILELTDDEFHLIFSEEESK